MTASWRGCGPRRETRKRPTRLKTKKPRRCRHLRGFCMFGAVSGRAGFGFATASGATPRLIIARRAVILTIGTATHGIQKKSPEGPLETLTPSPRTISVVGEAKDGI